MAPASTDAILRGDPFAVARIAAATACAACACAAAPGAATAADHVIRSQHGLITAVGPLTPDARGVDALRSLFGTPASVRPGDNACTVRFRRDHIAVTLANFGGGDPCAEGAAQLAQVNGRPWRTQRGLRIGDGRGRMLRLYPKARLRRGRWELLRGRLFGRREPTLRATVSRGRVRSLEAFLGGAGD